ncbi:MAG: lipoyl(octanoyl) transferase LipB [Anaerolineales bacterium]
MTSREWTAHWLGQVPYRQAWELQNRLADQIGAGKRLPTLLLLEHPHTFTLGRQGHLENLLWSEAELARKGVDLIWTDRGGDITYHGPGQLVGYPLLPLGAVDGSQHLPRANYVGYLRRLEDVLIRTLAAFGLVSGQIAGKTGVWVQPDVASRCRHCPPAARKKPSKIASIGVKVDAHGVSRHGFALNVAPDMSFWEGIVACGLADDPAISLSQLSDPPPRMEKVIHQVIDAFRRVFETEITQSPMEEQVIGEEKEQQS